MDSNEAILRYSTEEATVDVTEGLSVRDAFAAFAEDLGWNPSSATTFRSGNAVIPGNEQVVAGRIYDAATSRETKG